MIEDIALAEAPLAPARSDRAMIAGVCGGAAERFGVDATLLRVVLVAATILGFGSGLVVYLAAWFLAP